MKKNWRLLWMKILLIAAAVGLLLYFFFDGLKFEILGGAMGTLLAVVGSNVAASFLLMREEKNKLASGKFSYDKAYYYKRMKIGGGETEIWYGAEVSQGDVRFEVEDEPEKRFELHPILQANFSAIMEAHCASFISNPLMVRLDDYKIEEDGTVKLFTSRTAFYNDLVTNRAMDYKFNGEMSVREIYENERYLTPLKESKMSNHIGFGAFVFYGNSMVITRRGGNATLSKKQFTETLAFGFSEADILKAHAVEIDESAPLEQYPRVAARDMAEEVLLVRFAELFGVPLKSARRLHAEGKIRIEALGFGRVVYMGGKPQFYFAIIVDEHTDLFNVGKKKANSVQNTIDINDNLLFVEEIKLVKNSGHTIKVRTRGSKKYIKGAAQKSFFINYWHLCVRPRIEGVPQWVYDCN